MNVPETFIETLRQKVDIVEVISEYVPLRRSGRSYVGLCPFHNERTPSFSVSPERQVYHCFGCGAGGTVFRFLMDIEGISFTETVSLLAERCGIPLPDSFRAAAPRSPKLDRYRQAHELAAKAFNHILMNTDAGVQALQYLLSRGISRTTMANYQLGYAPPSGRAVMSFLQQRGFSPEELLACGLAVDLGGEWVDRFRGRVIVPIADGRGQIVAFGARALHDSVKPKYLNSPEYELFHKGRMLFNLHRARRAIRQERKALLLEGYMDVLAVAQAGIEWAVATLGTSLTEEQARLLKADCDRVVIAYDGDEAGRKATVRAIEVLEHVGITPVVLRLGDGMDPDEFIRAHGARAFERMLNESTWTVVQFLMEDLRQRAEWVSPAGRTEFLRKALKLLAERASPVEQEYQLRNLSQEFNLSVETLKEEMRGFAKPIRRRSPPREDVAPWMTPRAAKGKDQVSLRILQAALFSQEAAEYLMEKGVTELGHPLHTALLSHVYSWRIDQPGQPPSALIDRLEDEECIRLASSLLFDEPPEISTEWLEDHLRALEIAKLEQELKEKVRAWNEAEASGDEEKSREIKLQVEWIQSRMATMKQPRALHAE
ncbi:DNA primase [Alicyclobacillus vulcanalis]|uniref:DNA primase n=1 Tax=Alicyclobacillus vulcanalis TaxID=252246 RepID=A0A1N7KYC5_9BACL|nr:DNA primase [Alicyclobacillus vulcanalis]SIS66584.1 DNA primase [Alicyclobacillus vulcanalis]